MSQINPAFVNPAMTLRPQCLIRPGTMGLVAAPGHSQMVRPIAFGGLGVPTHFNPAMSGIQHPLLMLDQQSLLQHQQLIQQQQQQQQLIAMNPNLSQAVLANQMMVCAVSIRPKLNLFSVTAESAIGSIGWGKWRYFASRDSGTSSSKRAGAKRSGADDSRPLGDVTIRPPVRLRHPGRGRFHAEQRQSRAAPSRHLPTGDKLRLRRTVPVLAIQKMNLFLSCKYCHKFLFLPTNGATVFQPVKTGTFKQRSRQLSNVQ